MRAHTTATFESILSPRPAPARPAQPQATLHDLALDQVFTRIGEHAPRAASAFRTPLGTVEEVEYRHAVFRGLEHAPVRSAVDAFLEAMGRCDRCDRWSATSHAPYEGELWHLRALVGYVGAVHDFAAALAEALAEPGVRGDGWDGLERHLAEHLGSPALRALESVAVGLRDDLAALRYNALLRGAKVTIAPTDDEEDLGAVVRDTFARFRRGDPTDHRTPFRAPELDHVQAWMLERVAQVHPEPFARLVRCARETTEYRDPVLVRFADEVRFYLAYLDALAPMRRGGLPVCCPRVSGETHELRVDATWDLALASRLVAAGEEVVTNDVSLLGEERILVISGPNQGGKTTLARLVGQVHHLAAIGCPVPGRDARVFLCDAVLTVFEREESSDSLEGRLGAEVRRLHTMFEQVTERSVVVINEAFASTALHDARILTRDVLERISHLGVLAVCVTFIDELSCLNARTVSMVAGVDPADPSVRTFRIERREADGRAYARALAAQHGLTLEQIRDRLEAPSPIGATEGDAA